MGSCQCNDKTSPDLNQIITGKNIKKVNTQDEIEKENSSSQEESTKQTIFNYKTLDLEKEIQLISEVEVNLHEEELTNDFGVCREGCIRRDSFTEGYYRLLNGNKQYAREKIDEDPEYFHKRAKHQKPKYLLIGCSDSRVPPNEITKTNPGEIFIHRNIANQVIHSDLNCMSVIQYAIEYLHVEHVIIMGHTKSGGISASKNKTFKGLIENWIQNIKDVAYLNKEELQKCVTDDEYFDKLTLLNIRHQVWNVCKTPYVQKAWANGMNLHIHGWLMDIDTGIIKDLKMNNKDWDVLKNYYDFIFNKA